MSQSRNVKEEDFYDMITVSPPPNEFSGSRMASIFNSDAINNDLSKPSGREDTFELRDSSISQGQRLDTDQLDLFSFANPHPSSRNTDYLSPGNLGLTGNSPQNSDLFSAHSLYSDVSSNAHSPFQDAASHLSTTSHVLPTNYSSGFFETVPPTKDSFNEEIILGQSISSTNLSNLNARAYGTVQNEWAYTNDQNSYMRLNQESQAKPEEDFSVVNSPHPRSFNLQLEKSDYQDSVPLPTFETPDGPQFDKLTENNLSSYNENADTNITISIHQAPEVVAAHTPSLFSNSSHNSSPNAKANTHGNQLHPPGSQISRASSPSLSLNPPSPSHSWNYTSSPTNSTTLPSPRDAPHSDTDLGESYLSSEEFHYMRRGRQSAHSLKVRSQQRSRAGSKSPSSPRSFAGNGGSADDNDNGEIFTNKAASREKMLELASSTHTSKRTQKHPSLYACHLCDKRFTRPYNLKSHLRTHTDDRPFICNVCGKAFARQHDRKRHEDLHLGEKKYQCKGVLRNGTTFGCGRKFARADALRRHFQTGSGKECIRLLLEEDAREHNSGDNVNSGIQMPDGEFINPNFQDIPVLSVSPPE